MPCLLGHKTFINSVVRLSFKFSTEESKLVNEITNTVLAIQNGSATLPQEYTRFQKYFHNPRTIRCLEFYNTYEKEKTASTSHNTCIITIGAAKKYMIEYIGDLIAQAAAALGKRPGKLGWNQDSLLIDLKSCTDYYSPLLTLMTNERFHKLLTYTQLNALDRGLNLEQIQAPDFEERFATGICDSPGSPRIQ